PLNADHVRVAGIRMGESVTPMEVPHVPKLGANVLRHADAVACIVLPATRVYRHALPKLLAEFAISLEPAGAEDDAVARLYAFNCIILGPNCHSEDFLRLACLTGDQPERRRLQHHFDITKLEIVLDHLERHRATGS